MSDAAMTAIGGFNAALVAEKVAFDRDGSGQRLLLLSGFPQTRRSWNRMIPLLSLHFETIAADRDRPGIWGIMPH